MSSLFSRLFGSSSSNSTSTATSPKVARAVPIATSDAADSLGDMGSAIVWLTRDGNYWTDEKKDVLARLRAEWSQSPDAAKWPDVLGLLDQLAAPPEEVIRQLPAAARDAMALCEREDLPRSRLVDRLSQDPSLVQALLRQANGAFYGAGLSPILSVGAAIDRIGVAGTRAVVLAASVDGLLSKPGGEYDAMLAAAWSHMVNTAPLARALAPVFGADGEEAFAVSLLHNVGLLIIFDRISSLRTANRRPVALPPEYLGVLIAELHEPIGAMAAHQWGLGSDAADAIGTHHRRDRPSVRHPLAETIFLADHAAQAAARSEVLDFFGLWDLGELEGDQVHCRGVLERHVLAA